MAVFSVLAFPALSVTPTHSHTVCPILSPPVVSELGQCCRWIPNMEFLLRYTEKLAGRFLQCDLHCLREYVRVIFAKGTIAKKCN